MRVLYEDNHLLVINKPSGLATMGVAAGEDSAVVQAKAYLKEKYHKPGNVYVGVVSRLDRLASGVLVLARTSKAAARLTKQFAEREVEKIYWAAVEPAPRRPAGQLVDWLVKDEAAQRMRITRSETPGAQQAQLDYRVLKRRGRSALLEINLHTGRKHQIRVQLAHHGWPILGDRKYGSHAPFPLGIALHARELTLRHPVRDERLTFTAPWDYTFA